MIYFCQCLEAINVFLEINAYEAINAFAEIPALCPYLHLPIQSGSDRILERMGRAHTAEFYLDWVQQFRDAVPHGAIASDFIVGFPGETDAEFEETLEACRQARFMKVHVFPFSRRKGTPAADFDNQVKPEVRKERCRILGQLERDLAEDYYRTLVGRDLEVLIERESRDRPGWVRGTDRRYAPVELPGASHDIGTFVSARGEAADRQHVSARRVSPQRVGTEALVGSL